MRGSKKAGRRWRILVHEASKASKAYHVESADIVAEDKRMGVHRQPSEHSAHFSLGVPTDFDELVIGHWIHLEEMDNGFWWMDIGGVTVHVTADKDGNPKHVTVHMPGSYANPVPGCTYALDDEPYEREPIA